ncbi:hypothetical protein [Oceanotoga phage vB_OteS-UFV02]
MTSIKKSEEKIKDLRNAVDLINKIKSYVLNSNNISKLDRLDNELFSIFSKYHLDYFTSQEDLLEMIEIEKKKIAPYRSTLKLFQEVEK